MPGVLDPVLFTPHACLLEEPCRGRIVGVAARGDAPEAEVVERSRQQASGEISCYAPAREFWIDDVPDDALGCADYSALVGLSFGVWAGGGEAALYVASRRAQADADRQQAAGSQAEQVPASAQIGA